jgi:hypothetical protein
MTKPLTMKQKASKWAERYRHRHYRFATDAYIFKVFTDEDIETAYRAGFRAGKKEGFIEGEQYANGKWTSVLQREEKVIE